MKTTDLIRILKLILLIIAAVKPIIEEFLKKHDNEKDKTI